MSRPAHATVLLTSLLAALLSVTVRPASAQVYNAANDFSVAANPNGVWSYGWSNTLGSTFILDAHEPSNVQGFSSQIDLYANSALQNNLGYFPYISHNNGSMAYTATTQVWQPNQILVHPGPDNEYSVIRWTAPSAGTWTVNTVFDGQDTHGTTSDVHVLLKGVALFNDTINGYLSATSFNQTIVTNPGDTLDFAVGYGTNGSYFFDSTGLAVNIQPFIVPEPGPTSYLIDAALFVSGLSLRRRPRSQKP